MCCSRMTDLPLQDTILNRDRQPADRILLVLYLKYLVNKCWRQGVSEDDKRAVRSSIVRILLLDQPQVHSTPYFL